VIPGGKNNTTELLKFRKLTKSKSFCRGEAIFPIMEEKELTNRRQTSGEGDAHQRGKGRLFQEGKKRTENRVAKEGRTERHRKRTVNRKQENISIPVFKNKQR